MSSDAYKIRDLCRRNIVKYTLNAFSLIPDIDESLVLDMGCGTGESVLALLEINHCKVVAVDSDIECVSILNEKVKASSFGDRIKVIHGSIFDQDCLLDLFDIVLAEGLLNIIGFEKGLVLLLKHLKQKGYLIIHDELENDGEKREIFKKYSLNIIGTLELNQIIWWNEYYGCLERSIMNNEGVSHINEINEIIEYKKNPDKCKSIIYVLSHAMSESIEHGDGSKLSIDI
jgi:SAM-dependent methyltransferase